MDNTQNRMDGQGNLCWLRPSVPKIRQNRHRILVLTVACTGSSEQNLDEREAV